MDMTTDPMFTLYVVWHPSYHEGEQIADLLRTHFGRDLYRGVEEERAVSVLERSQPLPDTPTPLPIDWDDTEFTAVVVLAETFLIEDRDWVEYVRAIAETARGLPAGFFPVTMDNRGLDLGVVQQALRWDLWGASDVDPVRRLISDLTHEFCRMLRHRLGQLRPAGGEDDALGACAVGRFGMWRMGWEV
ncbi:MAG: hypothetical protein OXE76_06975, partial [Alphaproteobacteria bacterium]|nr:hypothetical protein [Alphaproteobacteria bacterium]